MTRALAPEGHGPSTARNIYETSSAHTRGHFKISVTASWGPVKRRMTMLALALVRRFQVSLWPDCDLQGLGRFEALAKDAFSGWDFGDGVGVDDIAAARQGVAEGNLKVGCSRL